MPDLASGSEPSLDALFATLKALQARLPHEDFDATVQAMDAYDLAVRSFMSGQSLDQADASRLQALLALQRDVEQEMSQLRDDAAGHLRTHRQSARVARAYQQAEHLE